MATQLTRRSIFAQAWPIMLGQTTVPLVGLVDTWVIGRTGDAAALAGVALGTTVVNFIFWSFGFLRMGMTGMTAQAQGAGNRDEVRAMLVRGTVAGFGIGLAIVASQIVLIPAAFALLAGGGALDAAAKAFTAARFFGAPAGLAVFAITGWLLGLGRTRSALVLQIVMNRRQHRARPVFRARGRHGRARCRLWHCLRRMDRARDRCGALLAGARAGEARPPAASAVVRARRAQPPVRGQCEHHGAHDRSAGAVRVVHQRGCAARADHAGGEPRPAAIRQRRRVCPRRLRLHRRIAGRACDRRAIAASADPRDPVDRGVFGVRGAQLLRTDLGGRTGVRRCADDQFGRSARSPRRCCRWSR